MALIYTLLLTLLDFLTNTYSKVSIKHPILLARTSYLTDSYIVFTLKMESVSKNTIFGLKMMVKSSLEKIF